MNMNRRSAVAGLAATLALAACARTVVADPGDAQT